MNLSILIILGVLAQGFCVCNKSGLAKINAFVKKTREHKAEFLQNVNFYLLDDYEIIDVARAENLELCEGTIRDFPKLKRLSMINLNLTRFKCNAFQNVPKLQELYLSVNNLEGIDEDDFSCFQNLKVLYLSNNRISYIEENAFAFNMNLRRVYLDKNRITRIIGKVFQGLPLLRVVDLSSNKISAVYSNDLKGFQTEHPLTLMLKNNAISEFEGEALSALGTVNLHLENNLLEHISDLLFNLKPNSRLYLDGNQVSCVSDEVVETMKNTTKFLYLRGNPLDCNCLNHIGDILGEEIMGKGEFHYNSKFPCELGFGQPIQF